MKFFNNLRLGIKLGICFGILGICMLAIGLFGFEGMSKLKDEVTTLAKVQTVAIAKIGKVDSNIKDILAEITVLVNEKLAPLHINSKNRIDTLEKETNELLKEYANLNTSTAGTKNLEDFGRYRTEFINAVNNIIKTCDNKDFDSATQQYMNLSSIQENLMKESNLLIKSNENDAVTSLTKSLTLYQNLRNALIGFLSISAFCGIFIIIILVRFIVKNINDIMAFANSMSEGDFTKRINVTTNEQFGKLGHSLNIAVESINSTLEMISYSSSTLTNLVGDCNTEFIGLNGALQDTSAATEQLSASMEQTASSADEMSTTSTLIESSITSVSERSQFGAETAHSISHRANNLKESFTKSKENTDDMFSEIKLSLEKSIEDAKSIKKIDELATVILGITKKTNLLALNAAIEAARAGEAGNGFSVVADEIRGLATNSKAAVEQIRDVTELVTDSVKGLMKDSNKLLEFVGTDITNDYNLMLETTEIYSKDSEAINNISSDLNSISIEVSTSADNLIKSIKEVAIAANQGATTTELVADKVTEITMGAAKIMESIGMADQTAIELNELISNFKLSDNSHK